MDAAGQHTYVGMAQKGRYAVPQGSETGVYTSRNFLDFSYPPGVDGGRTQVSYTDIINQKKIFHVSCFTHLFSMDINSYR